MPEKLRPEVAQPRSPRRFRALEGGADGRRHGGGSLSVRFPRVLRAWQGRRRRRFEGPVEFVVVRRNLHLHLRFGYVGFFLVDRQFFFARRRCPSRSFPVSAPARKRIRFATSPPLRLVADQSSSPFAVFAGTTGPTKAGVLTHDNIAWTVDTDGAHDHAERWDGHVANVVNGLYLTINMHFVRGRCERVCRCTQHPFYLVCACGLAAF